MLSWSSALSVLRAVASDLWFIASLSLDECSCIVCLIRSLNLVDFSDVTVMTSSVAVSAGVCCEPPRLGFSLGGAVVNEFECRRLIPYGNGICSI